MDQAPEFVVDRKLLELEPLHHRHLTSDVLIAGSGRPIVVLHRDTGRAGWSEFHHALAAHFKVYAPALPGFPGASVPPWARSTTDLAALTGHLLDVLSLGPVPIVGLGFGGWVAAEIAAMSPGRVTSLVLQAPMGICPPEGEILDQFLVEAIRYVQLGFSSDMAFQKVFGEEVDPSTREIWEGAREMTVRIAWKPYMYSLSLPYLLRTVDLPTHVVWGSDDQIVPVSCAAAYRSAIKGTQISTIPGGHQLDLENPTELVAAVVEFFGEHPDIRP